jgi:4-hydroxybenzoate polyprenyltransferase
MSGLGLINNLKIIPEKWAAASGIAKLKDMPGSRTAVTAVAWGVLAALIPVMCSSRAISWATATAFFFVAGVVFIRSGLFEIMAIEGDRVVGKETLALVLGKERTLTLMTGCAVILMTMMLAAAWGGVIPDWGYFLSLCGAYALGYLLLYRFGLMEPGLMLEGLVEGNMVLAGLLAFLWDPFHSPFIGSG